ncbi:MAG: S-methyl-5-thioribose-1-phosphate isomerase [Candidatus Diapherotrites archaeon]|nr:S-methyl-5-thioribose-1-phosphate isomerase [Candidatus Diapherotrites archaeon]
MQNTKNKIRISAGKIKRLEIQGARNVAKEAVRAVLYWARETEKEPAKGFMAGLEKNAKILASSRPTEPMLRNALKYIILKAGKEKEFEKRKNKTISACKDYLLRLPKEHEKISEFGSNLIPDNSTILIHCHSNTVMAVIKRAFDKGKKFSVICTETRPLFQGRISAKELSTYGINTTLIVDSAARHIMNDVDLFFSGADAITSDGFVVNKIGTSLISLAAKAEEAHHYVCTSSHKFDPLTLQGFLEPIENRSSLEVIKSALQKNLKVLNPAFDCTEIELVRGIICEMGVLTPQTFISSMVRDAAELNTL